MATHITGTLLSDKTRKIDAMRAMSMDFKEEIEQLVLEKKQLRRKVMPDHKDEHRSRDLKGEP